MPDGKSVGGPLKQISSKIPYKWWKTVRKTKIVYNMSIEYNYCYKKKKIVWPPLKSQLTLTPHDPLICLRSATAPEDLSPEWTYIGICVCEHLKSENLDRRKETVFYSRAVLINPVYNIKWWLLLWCPVLVSEKKSEQYRTPVTLSNPQNGSKQRTGVKETRKKCIDISTKKTDSRFGNGRVIFLVRTDCTRHKNPKKKSKTDAVIRFPEIVNRPVRIRRYNAL